jgi:hypothetical protein
MKQVKKRIKKLTEGMRDFGKDIAENRLIIVSDR